MSKDIRQIVKNYQEKKVKLSDKHQQKMQAKLMRELHQKPKKKYNFKFISVAASILLIISFGVYFNSTKNLDSQIKNIDYQINKSITLGAVSPELNTIEIFYTNAINYEISQLEMTDETKEIVDQYLLKIGALTKEYQSLSEELKNGINDDTIEALINNLQLRLQLLKRLKKQLNDFKKLNKQTNENTII